MLKLGLTVVLFFCFMWNIHAQNTTEHNYKNRIGIGITRLYGFYKNKDEVLQADSLLKYSYSICYKHVLKNNNWFNADIDFNYGKPRANTEQFVTGLTLSVQKEKALINNHLFFLYGIGAFGLINRQKSDWLTLEYGFGISPHLEFNYQLTKRIRVGLYSSFYLGMTIFTKSNLNNPPESQVVVKKSYQSIGIWKPISVQLNYAF